MKRVKQSFSTRMLMLALFLGVLAYFGVQAVRYIDDPLTTTLAYPYQVETGLELSGWVVRQERVLEDESGDVIAKGSSYVDEDGPFTLEPAYQAKNITMMPGQTYTLRLSEG